MNRQEQQGMLEILQLVMTHQDIRDYADSDLRAALEWINKQLLEYRK